MEQEVGVGPQGQGPVQTVTQRIERKLVVVLFVEIDLIREARIPLRPKNRVTQRHGWIERSKYTSSRMVCLPMVR